MKPKHNKRLVVLLTVVLSFSCSCAFYTNRTIGENEIYFDIAVRSLSDLCYASYEIYFGSTVSGEDVYKVTARFVKQLSTSMDPELLRLVIDRKNKENKPLEDIPGKLYFEFTEGELFKKIDEAYVRRGTINKKIIELKNNASNSQKLQELGAELELLDHEITDLRLIRYLKSAYFVSNRQGRLAIGSELLGTGKYYPVKIFMIDPEELVFKSETISSVRINFKTFPIYSLCDVTKRYFQNSKVHSSLSRSILGDNVIYEFDSFDSPNGEITPIVASAEPWKKKITASCLLVIFISILPAVLIFTKDRKFLKDFEDNVNRDLRSYIVERDTFGKVTFCLFYGTVFMLSAYLGLWEVGKGFIPIIGLLLVFISTIVGDVPFKKRTKRIKLGTLKYSGYMVGIFVLYACVAVLFLIIKELLYRTLSQILPGFSEWEYYSRTIILFLGSYVILQYSVPLLFKFIMRAKKVTSEKLLKILLDLEKKAGLRIKGLLVVRSEKIKIANALTIGLYPSQSRIIFLDYFLNNSNDDEIEAVMAHEIGHVKSYHLLKIMGVFMVALLIQIILGEWFSNIFSLLSFHFHSSLLQVNIIVILIFCFVYFFIRRFEKQADIYSANLTGKPDALISALKKLAYLNQMKEKLTPLEEALQTHPSLERRINYLESLKNEVSTRDAK